MLPGKKVSPAFVLSVVRRRLWWLLAPTLITAFAALVVSARLPNVYQTQALIHIIPQRVPEGYVRSTVTGRTESRLDNVQQQVTSRNQLEQIITEFDLYPVERQTLPMQDVVNLMRAAVLADVVPPPRGQPLPDEITVKFSYSRADLAAKVTDRLATLFVNENARDRGASADTTNTFFETHLADTRNQLEAQEQKVEAFRQRHAGRLPSQQDTNLAGMLNAQMQLLNHLESLARDRDRKLIFERMYNDAEAEPLPPPPPAPVAVAAPNAGQAVPTGTTEQQLQTAKAQLAALQQRFQPEHPDIIRWKRTVTELEERAKKEAAAQPAEAVLSSSPAAAAAPVVLPEMVARRERLRQLRADIDTLEGQISFKQNEEARLRKLIADYQTRLEAAPELESEWAALTRDLDTLQGAYKDLRGKSEQSKIAADLERRQVGEQFRVIGQAAVPTKPIRPVRIQINGIGLGVGLLLGLGLIALLELRDTSFRTPTEVLEVLSLPVVAFVPRMSSAAEQARARRAMIAIASVAVVAMAGGAYVFWSMRLWKFLI